MMKLFMSVLLVALLSISAFASELSDKTKACLECHNIVTPAIVSDWEKSLHSKVTLKQAFAKSPLQRRVSADKVSDEFTNVVVGCAECHMLNIANHEDSFDHNGYMIQVVVSPNDCATCHPVEAKEYSGNIMSHAYANLTKNPVYMDLVNTTNGLLRFDKMKTDLELPDDKTSADSCLWCHGTVVQVTGKRSIDTSFGSMEFPVLSNWPNQGVGRINPDESRGSCASCHVRHAFSIEVARKPYTCAECHKGPDVPAYKVYEVSKHGNVFSSSSKGWDFTAVPWKVGDDFNAPTCAACHVSLLTTREGEVIAKRTHRMNDRLDWRIFGLVYAHPHPKSPDTTVIVNKAGLPLPTELTGEPVSEFLIDSSEQRNRRERMKKVCLACHSSGWIDGHFDRLDNTIQITNELTLQATKVLLTAWEKGVAKGLSKSDSIFNEAIEKMGVEQWLFFANSTRFASAMSGADYGAFANGRWYMMKNINGMIELLDMKLKVKEK